MTTILFTDGFDLYNISYGMATNGGDWRSISGGSDTWNAGRFGGQAWNHFSHDIGSPLWTAQSALCVGLAFETTNIAALAAANLWYMLSGGDNTTSNRQLAWGVNASGQPFVTNGTTTWTAAMGTPLANNNWYYLELCVHSFNASTGSFDLYCEGINVLSKTNVNTNPVASGTCDRICLKSENTVATVLTDDLYVNDGTALGPCRIDTLRPSSDASVTWSHNSGTNNFSRVNETLVDGDTSYVFDSTVNDQDLYGIGSLPVTPTNIWNVQHRYVARKDDAGTRQVAGVVKSGTTTNVETTQTMNSSYQTFRNQYNTDPNTSAAWGASAVNSLQIGQKTIA